MSDAVNRSPPPPPVKSPPPASPAPTPPATLAAGGKYAPGQVIWADEFSGFSGANSGIDPAKWNFQNGDGSYWGIKGAAHCCLGAGSLHSAPACPAWMAAVHAAPRGCWYQRLLRVCNAREVLVARSETWCTWTAAGWSAAGPVHLMEQGAYGHVCLRNDSAWLHA